MQKHKYNIFPDASPEDFDRLVADIRSNGYDRDFPIVIYQGAILDGWNRWRACQHVGEKPATKEFTGTDADAIHYALRTNKRRNLTSSQWATIAVDAEEIMAAIAADVERERRMKISESRKVETGEQIPPSQSTAPTRTAVKAAAIFNTNDHYIKTAKRLKATQPEAFRAVQSGEKTITQVKKEAQKAKRKEIAIKLEQANKEIASLESLPCVYRVIYADPPWQYGNDQTQALPGSTRPDDHYKTMPTPEIAALPVKNIALENSVLFLWTTTAHLEESFQVVQGWGFKYKTHLIWDKESHNYGPYTSVQHEILILATRGACTPEKSGSVSSVVRIQKTAHSEKPEEFRQIIENMYPWGQKIELFARRPVDGWDTWGNEA